MSLRTGITPLRETPEEKREVPKVGKVENSSIHPRNQIYLDQACDPRCESYMYMGGQQLLPQHLPSTFYLLASLGQQGRFHHTWHCLNLKEGRVQTRGSCFFTRGTWKDLQLPRPTHLRSPPLAGCRHTRVSTPWLLVSWTHLPLPSGAQGPSHSSFCAPAPPPTHTYSPRLPLQGVHLCSCKASCSGRQPQQLFACCTRPKLPANV